MLKLDFTQLSVVVTCDACPWWHGFGFARLDAWLSAARHERGFHAGQHQARKAFDCARRNASDLERRTYSAELHSWDSSNEQPEHSASS